MWEHYLIILYRSLWRHRLYAALNVLGLAVGIAVFLVLLLDVRFETSFERWIPNARQVYVVRTIWADPTIGANNATMGGTLDELRGDYPQLIGTRIWDQQAVVRQGAEIRPAHLIIVDPSFFQVFDLPMTAGNKSTLLRSPDQILLTEAEAKRDFGSAEPLGRDLTVAFLGAPRTYRITGILKDQPKNTDLTFDMVVPLTPQMAQGEAWRHWGTEMLTTYLRFAQPAGAKALDDNLDAFVDRHAGSDLPPPPVPHKQIKLRTQPLLSLHLLDPKDAAVVVGLGAVGVLTLLLAAVNYVNLATARAGLRAREVALRKVMGATRQILVAQFMAEAVVTAAIGALIGLALCELALPLVNAAGGSALRINYLGGDSILLLLAGATALIGVGAGVYPALVLSRFQSAAVLASARAPGGGRAGARVREALVVFQFAIAIAFTVATGVILAETHYLHTADLGFRRHGLVVVSSFFDSEVTGPERASLITAWRSLPGVVSVTAGDVAPGGGSGTEMEGFKRPGTPGAPLALQQVSTGPGFFETYGARLLAGRLLDRARGGDDTPSPSGPSVSGASGTVHDVVTNLKAVHTLGFRNPADAVGKLIYEARTDGGLDPLMIVGVVGDVRFDSPRDPIAPTVYFLRTRDFRGETAAIRYASPDALDVMGRIQATWRKIAPSVPFRARTVEDNLHLFYRSAENNGRMFVAGAVLAVTIGCIGLYGLAAFSTSRRVKEIGIRKTLGASTADILRLLVGQFLRPVIVANVLAWPLSFFAMRTWLSGFDQRVALSPLYFIGATVLTLLVALATVVGQALLVARAEPAKALRHE